MASSDGNCGAQSALSRLSSHLAKDQTKFQERQRNTPQTENINPSTFHMGALLQEANQLIGSSQSPSWASEMLSHQRVHLTEDIIQTPSGHWADQFLIQHSQNSSFSGHTSSPVYVQSSSLNITPFTRGVMAPIHAQNRSWAEQFLSEQSHHIVHESVLHSDSELKDAAQKLITDIIDPDFQSTDFAAKMRQVAQTGMVDDEGEFLDENLREMRERMYDNSESTESEIWNNFLNTIDSAAEFTTPFQRQDGASVAGWDNPLLSSNQRSANAGIDSQYQFRENNVYTSLDDPYAEGVSLLNCGRIAEAVVAFEAAVQKKADHVEAWEKLAVTLAENEQDQKAHLACKKCLELDSQNSTALLSLARNYANDLSRGLVLSTLVEWLKSRPAYSAIVQEDMATDNPLSSPSFGYADDGFNGMYYSSRKTFASEFAFVEQMMLKACRSQLDSVDPDFQTALGILYHMDSQYDKAIDCFQTALQVRPDDALLWNKLGAALANSDSDHQAIHAYRQALELAPGFVRARCNLGIACIALQAYREALEHGVEALKLQMGARKTIGQSVSTNESHSTSSVHREDASVWHLIEVAARRSCQEDFIRLAESRDLDGLISSLDRGAT